MVIKSLHVLVITGILLIGVCLNDVSGADKTQCQILQNSMIWLRSSRPGEQAYVVFRKEFILVNEIQDANLQIFADTRYMLWINGQYVERGPCRFDPKHPEYDVLKVGRYLVRGENTIAILVHHYAINSFTEWFDKSARMMYHNPGLTASLTIPDKPENSVLLVTDSSWKGSAHTRFLLSPGSYASVPDNIDARLDQGDWTLSSFDDSKWENASKINGEDWGKFTPRTIPLLRDREIIPLKISGAVVDEAPKEKSQSNLTTLPLKIGTGYQVIVDIGKVVQAYPVLDFNAADSSKLEFGYATLLDQNKGVPFQEQFTNMNSRYISKQGEQNYTSGDTYGFRYLIIKVLSGEITLNGVTVIERSYPFVRRGSFSSNDELLNWLWNTCVNTVEACSEDAYVDCADRERAQWMADGYKMNYPVSRTVLAVKDENGGYRYSDSRLLKNMLRVVALSQLPDGRVQPMRPSDYKPEDRHGVIDDYSCLFVQALREYTDRTGDLAFLKEVWPQAKKTMDYFIHRKMADGLIKANEFVYFDNPLINVNCEGATINGYIYGSLRDIARLADKLGYTVDQMRFTQEATKLYVAYNKLLWNENDLNYYAAIIGEKTEQFADNPPSFTVPYNGLLIKNKFVPPTAHAALMALNFNLVPDERRGQVMAYMLKCCQSKQMWWPYTSRYFLDVLFSENDPVKDQMAMDYIRNSFGHMAEYESGTTSEDWKKGSFVHESGSHPAYFLSNYVLGVRTELTEKGVQLIIQPRLGDLKKVEGTVLCEFGEVPVKWETLPNGNLNFSFSIPKKSTACVFLPLKPNVIPKSLTINRENQIKDSKLSGNGKIEDRYFRIKLSQGSYSGEINY